MDNIIEIYTDGSAIDNGNPDARCGWACKLMYNGASMLKSGNAVGLTNNQAEMLAVINALKSVKDKTIHTIVYSDSKYVVETLNGKYSINTNEDWWDKLMAERDKFHHVWFVWVKGHSGNPHNEEVDQLALKEAENARPNKLPG